MLLLPGLVSMTLAAGPVLTSAYAAGGDDPSSPRYIHTIRGVGFRFATAAEAAQ